MSCLSTCSIEGCKHFFGTMGNSLWAARPSDTDIRYDDQASDNLLDQSPVWSTYNGFWGPHEFTYISDFNSDEGGSFRQPELYNLTSGIGWPYKRDVFQGYRQVIVDGSRFTSRTFMFYEPAPKEFCEQDVPPGTVNVVGTNKQDPTNTTAACGVNGNVVIDQTFTVSSYERNGEAIAFWSTIGPVYGGRGGRNPPGVTSFAKPVVDDALFTYFSFDIPGYPMVFSNTETFLQQGDSIASFGSGTSARGLPSQYNSFIYSATKMKDDEQEFQKQLLQAYKDHNITDDEIPSWLKEGKEIPSCLAEGFGGCPTEDDYCGPDGIDPSCTTSPYQDPPRSMKPGAIAGFTIAAIVVVAIIGLFLHHRAIKKQKKRMRKQFAQQVAKRVDLHGSVSQLNPTDLLAEFNRIDKLQGGTSDGFISREELWTFVSSGKAGEISEKDFDLLFDSMDTRNRGKVNFVDFCAFMSTCSEEVHELANEKGGKNKQEMLRTASMRLSSKPVTRLIEVDVDEEATEGNDGTTPAKDIKALQHMHGLKKTAEVIDA